MLWHLHTTYHHSSSPASSTSSILFILCRTFSSLTLLPPSSPRPGTPKSFKRWRWRTARPSMAGRHCWRLNASRLFARVLFHCWLRVSLKIWKDEDKSHNNTHSDFLRGYRLPSNLRASCLHISESRSISWRLLCDSHVLLCFHCSLVICFHFLAFGPQSPFQSILVLLHLQAPGGNFSLQPWRTKLYLPFSVLLWSYDPLTAL